jgi:hypothetical protein
MMPHARGVRSVGVLHPHSAVIRRRRRPVRPRPATCGRVRRRLSHTARRTAVTRPLARQALTVNAAGGQLVHGNGPTTRRSVELLGLSVEHVSRHAWEYLSVPAALVRDGSLTFSWADFWEPATLRVPGPYHVLPVVLSRRRAT